MKNINSQNFGKGSLSTIGMSKIKALEDGTKRTGIYRNFYKSNLTLGHNLSRTIKNKSRTINSDNKMIAQISK